MDQRFELALLEKRVAKIENGTVLVEENGREIEKCIAKLKANLLMGGLNGLRRCE